MRNITDVGHLQNDTKESGEDRLEHEARTTGRSAYEIAAYYTQQYFTDQAELNILPAHVNPRATDHIPEMQAMTEKLVENGLAYAVDGNVYYDVSRFPNYGQLSGNTVENLRTGGHGRQQMEIAEDKDAPEDFAIEGQCRAGKHAQRARHRPDGLPLPAADGALPVQAQFHRRVDRCGTEWSE